MTLYVISFINTKKIFIEYGQKEMRKQSNVLLPKIVTKHKR